MKKGFCNMYYLLYNYPGDMIYLGHILVILIHQKFFPIGSQKVRIALTAMMVLLGGTFYSIAYWGLDKQVETLAGNLAQKKLSVEQQIKLTESPVLKVRLSIAESVTADVKSLSILKDDKSFKVKKAALMTLQKKNVIPLLKREDYQDFHEDLITYLFMLTLFVIISLALIYKRPFIAIPFAFLFLIFLGLELTPESPNRIMVIRYKIEHKTLTEADLESILETQTFFEKKELADNLQNLSPSLLKKMKQSKIKIEDFF